MLIIAILTLLLAITPSIEKNYNYLADYIKFNRIVFIIFILGAYLAYNILNVNAIGEGVGIYGGVFRLTVLSQVFDIILCLIGAIVVILTCFAPYHFKIYDDGLIKNNHLYSSKFFGIFNHFFSLEKKLWYSKLEVKEFSLLLLYTVVGASLLISVNNLVSLYLSLELQSFTLYIISSSQVRSFKGTSGGLKYFLLGGLSSGIILLACCLLYAYTGTLNIEHIFYIYSDSSINYILDPCLIILFAGLLFKVSAAPFHHWAPDVYSDVPTYTTTWLIVIAKVSIFIFMMLLIHYIHSALNFNNLNLLESYYNNKDLNLLDIQYNNINNTSILNYFFSYINIPFSFWFNSYSSLGLWTNIITISALLSLIIGTVVGLNQSRIKRLFAYSTITHVGFLLLALSLNSIAGLDAFIFYLIQYTITNLNLFFILVAWGYIYSKYYFDKDFIPIRLLSYNQDHYSIHPWTISNHSDFDTEDSEWLYTPVPFLIHFKGMHFKDPFLAFCLTITILSLAGIPPMIGFFAKQKVLLAALQCDYFFISIIIIFTSVIGAAYYLRIIKFIYFYDDVFMPYYISNSYNDYQHSVFFEIKNNNSLPMMPSNNLSLIIALLTNLSLFYFIKPYILINIIHMITIPLFLT